MHPVAFNIGSLTVHWYGIFVALGCLIGLWSASRRGLLDGIAPDVVYELGWWIMVGVVIGARAFYVMTFWETEFANAPWYHVLNIRQGGLVFYGGFVGAAAATLLHCRLKKRPLWRLADALAPSTALGSVFGRIGCLMTGCCYGKVCDLPWAVRFPVGHDTHGTAVHPTQIYDALLNLGVYVALELLFRRKRFDGQVFAAWLLIYPLTRSIAEIFRGDYPHRYIGGVLTPAHLVGIGILATGILLWKALPRRLEGAMGARSPEAK